MTPGPRNLITDVPGLKVGNAEDARIKTGTTVLTADAPFLASVHVMGGAPGTRETDLLAPDKTVEDIDALVLSGGSAFGLDAAQGVVDGLRAQGCGFAVGPVTVPIVPAAILFDLINGGEKDRDTSPYAPLGRAALEAASEDFSLGSTGAGTGALTAMCKGGLGSASMVLPCGTTVGALVAVNALGAVTMPGDRHFWAAPFEQGSEFGGHGFGHETGYGFPQPSRRVAAMGLGTPEQANTTIAIVATDATLTKAGAQRMAVAAHDGMARAIVPAHTPHDGDLVFAVSTRARPAEQTDPALLGHVASLCLARAIARGVYEATPAPNDLLPTYQALNS
ncbi:P1 family peptidase [Pseudaestuariivita sp.]|uniref:P1 family peptidase n=1 Tax=Pseudaestuariivita sp. TaxID=2211669 RepID=UPI004059BC7D